MNKHFIYFAVFLCLTSKTFSKELFRLETYKEPVSVCDGSLKKIVARVKASLPKGYLTPKQFRKKLEREGKFNDQFLEQYIAQAKTAVGTSEPPIVVAIDVKELPGVKLVIASERLVLNALSSHASLNIEANEFISDRDLFKSKDFVSVGGHDLQRHELFAFWDLARPDLKRSTIDLTEKEQNWRGIEQKFWKEWMTPILLNDPTFKVFLSSAIGTSFYETVGHEVLHAQFFTDEVFRAAILKYWRTKLTQAKRNKFVKGMLPGYQNIGRDEILAANEFMAYVLQPKPVQSLRSMPRKSKIPYIKGMRSIIPLVRAQRKPLLDYLRGLGIRPIQVKL